MPRLPTTEQARAIRRFYYWTNLGGEFFTCLLWPLPIWWGLRFILGILLSPEFAFQHLGWPFYALVLAGFLAWRVRRRQQRAAHALLAYQVGQQVTLRFVSLTSDWSAKINGAPRQVITLQVGDELLRLKTFDSTVVRAYLPAVQVAYVLAQYPDLVVPASILTPGHDRDAPARPVRDISF